MLEWTGERFLPWHEDAALAAEHLHRYAYASRIARGKRVLDIGCGEGYGSAILAAHAAFVIGVDLDAATVAHAHRKYSNANLDFLLASASELPFSLRFDLAVCFEVLEHLEDQIGIVAEIRRVLTPEGVLIISTPDKRTYTDEMGFENPFHVHELYLEELEELLRGQFSQIQMLGQEFQCGSRIWPVDTNKTTEVTEFQVRRHQEGFVVDANKINRPVYYVALAARDQALIPLPPNSLLTDADNYIGSRLKRIELELAERVEEIDCYRQDIEWQKKQISKLETQLQSRDEALEWRSELIRSRESQVLELEEKHDKAQRDLAEQIRSRESQVLELEEKHDKAQRDLAEQIRSRESQVLELEEKHDKAQRDLAEQIRSLEEQSNQLSWELTAIKASRGWRLLAKLREIRDLFFGVRQQ